MQSYKYGRLYIDFNLAIFVCVDNSAASHRCVVIIYIWAM